MTNVYPTLNSKINTILEGISRVKSIYAYPATKIDSYPAVVYYPSNFENRYETTGSNFKIYGYKLWIVVNTEGTTVENVFDSVMPKVVDAVLAAFDEGWDFNTIDGHRAWTTVETGAWTVGEENAGVEVTAELDLTVKLLTNI